VSIGTDGSFTYTPQANYTGTDSFNYTAHLGTASSTATVTIYVQNTTPVAFDDTFYGSFFEGYSLYATDATNFTGSILANDFDLEDRIEIASYSQPLYGTVSIAANGQFTYTPAANFAGVDAFTYSISDGTKTATATVHLQPLVAGVAALGENTLVRASEAQPPSIIPPSDFDIVDVARSAASISHTFARIQAELKAGRLTALANQFVGDKPIQINQDAALWADKDGKVNGSILFGRADAVGDVNDPKPFWEKKDQPFGTVSYDGSQFVGKLSIPRLDDTGKIVEVDTLTLDKTGLNGTLPLSATTRIKFDKGFDSVETGSDKMKYLVDKSGNFQVWRKDPNGNLQLLASAQDGEFKLKTIPFTVSASKTGFTFDSTRYGKISATWQNWANPTKVGVTINLGRDRKIELGYDYTQGPVQKTISAVLNTPTLNFGFNFSQGKVTFSGSYNWPGNTAPYSAFGFANVQLTLDQVNKKSSVTFNFSVNW
jgi:hypothetical protein